MTHHHQVTIDAKLPLIEHLAMGQQIVYIQSETCLICDHFYFRKHLARLLLHFNFYSKVDLGLDAVVWYPHDPMASVHLKLQRGDYFANQFRDKLEEFVRSDFWRLSQTRYGNWNIAITGNVSGSLMQEFGDAIHNYRSALDHLAFFFGSQI